MFLGMQDFDFAQIQSNLTKSNCFCPNFASIVPEFTSILLKLRLNLIKYAQNLFAICSCICINMQLHLLYPQLLRHWLWSCLSFQFAPIDFYKLSQKLSRSYKHVIGLEQSCKITLLIQQSGGFEAGHSLKVDIETKLLRSRIRFPKMLFSNQTSRVRPRSRPLFWKKRVALLISK